MEVWKIINHFPNYKISNYGRVYSIKRNIILKPCHDSWGYLIVSLHNEHEHYTTKISRLVAKAFISNSHNKPEVNHIDGNKENNHVDNLEWATRTENERHAFITGLNMRSSYDAGRPKRIIRDIDTGEIFYSVAECAKELKCTHSNIVNYFKRGGLYCAGRRLELIK